MASFRSCDLDEWTAEQLQIMKVSGNGTTRDYFKKHGVTETQMAVSKNLLKFNVGVEFNSFFVFKSVCNLI
jgi:hypothetical protein